MSLGIFTANHLLTRQGLCCLLLFIICLSTVQAQMWSLKSASGRYNVTIDRPKKVSLGAEQRWLVQVVDGNGRLAQINAVDIKGGMPAHQHGLVNTPVWTLDEQQHLVIESLRFHMPGSWFFELRFRDENGWDSVRVDFNVDATGSTDAGNTLSANTMSMHSHDEHIDWNSKEKAIIASLALPMDQGKSQALPKNSEKLIELGKALFTDRRLSGDGQTSCSDCHDPDRYFTSDQLAHATHQHSPPEEQAAHIKRDVMSVVGSASRPWLNWDGRKGELWSHALLPLEIEAELGNNRTRIARYVSGAYRHQFTEAFGEPPIDVQGRWPADAGPFGDDAAQANWNSMSANDRQQINSQFVSVGKALAAYQAQIQPMPGPFDHYAHSLNDGNANPSSLSPSAERGLQLFISDKARCINCHNNSSFTNHAFERVVSGNSAIDFGRSLGAQLYLYDEFNCQSPYSVLSKAQCEKKISNAKRQISNTPAGAFLTPGLRGLEKSAPYMHDGRFTTLESVISHYNTVGNPFGQANPLPEPGSLSQQDQKDLVAFLLSLGSAYRE
ncbi:MAG: cytochrome-c peroxidase [Granulosicoccus sp.]